ncbi:protein containing DUF1573 [gut metagenome]|uniref:Protein containing DUF1573 n=1 Tax=gut metagenome TaxID=749906 RepID=J9GR14_9ZZZZ
MSASAQAVLKIDKTTHNFGNFDENQLVSCVFSFTNTGDKPLVIQQALATCGCTVPQFTKEPIKPGAKGEIKITYNGKGKYPGHFKKAITIRSNASNSLVRIYVEGNMTSK